jgi:hypothetical protein
MDDVVTDFAQPAQRVGSSDGRPLRRAAELAALVGIAHVVLFLLSFWFVNQTPGVRASDAEIVAFYESDAHRRLILVGLYLMPFAGIAFLWFEVALRTWIGGDVRRGNDFLANIQLVSGILFVGLFFAAAAAGSVTAASVEFAAGSVDPLVARLFPQFGSTLLFFFALRMAAMFVFATSNLSRKANLLPAWFVWAGFVVFVVLLLTPSFSNWLILVFPAWVLVLSILLLAGVRRNIAPAVARAGRNEGGA